ncbi:putative periplasmic lipoprotein [Marivirga arenosa]|jgi:PBP1b-binding outer membrane lipoprotein LpoB|uniref:Uncharacterized protein n=1 Tax=Marivirga arenosa TaxID=3059076 RepID=A0AA49GFQ9_9BACT|nr:MULTISPECIES: hypothetical protein [unclassified Marivirga]WKK85015.1 hypothetical protein QYS48_23770 [Marivirga sp. ABR2-2]WNB17242.1 hypothetical protein QYS47_33350 [Marivirga sp. BKB1-2]
MKKFLLIILSALFIGACAQKTCPTYSYNDLDTINEVTVEDQSV